MVRARRAHPPPRPRPRRAPRSRGGGWGVGGRVSPGLHALSRLSKWRIPLSYITFIDTITNISYTLISLSSLKIARRAARYLYLSHTHHTLACSRIIAPHRQKADAVLRMARKRQRERARARATTSTTLHGGWMERRAPQIEADRGTMCRAQGKALHAPLFCARMERRDLTASAPRSPRGC